jgi:hypothetical protein
MSNKNILLKDYITVIEPSDELLSLVDAMSEMDLPRLGGSLPSTAEEIQAARNTVNTMIKEMMPAEGVEMFKRQSRNIDIEGPTGKIPLRIVEPEGEIKWRWERS